MKVDVNGKQKTLYAGEFAEKVVVGKQKSKSQVTRNDFKLALWHISGKTHMIYSIHSLYLSCHYSFKNEIDLLGSPLYFL